MNVAHFRRRRALLSSPPAHFKLWPDLPASRSLSCLMPNGSFLSRLFVRLTHAAPPWNLFSTSLGPI